MGTPLEPLALDILVRRVLAIRQSSPSRLKPQVRVVYDADNLPLVWADEARLQQVLHNLLLNAEEAIGAKGAIRITAEPLAATLRISVDDLGSPSTSAERIAAFEHLALINDNPDRAPQPGLRLRVTRQVVEALGGQIGMEARGRFGIRTWFTLPLADQAALN
ncbi:MAG: sensor histidine kinase [Chloroflexota bacterium]